MVLGRLQTAPSSSTLTSVAPLLFLSNLFIHSQFTLGFTLIKWIVLHVLWVWTNIMRYIHHYNVIWSISLLIKISVLRVFISSPPKLLATIDLFIVSIVLPFPDGIIGIYFSFLFPWKERFKAFMSVRPFMAHAWVDLTGSRWQTSPLNTVAFLPVLSPVPLVLPSSHVEVQGDMCWVFAHRKATSFVPLVTMNPDSCWVCCKQRSHFFRPLFLYLGFC